MTIEREADHLGRVPAVRVSVAELSANVGMELGRSRWLTIGMDDVRAFADATGDHQWIHVDAERAGSGPFGAPVAHGYFLLTAVARLFPQILEITGRSMSVNYGTESVRFLSPVRAGSNVRLVGVLAGADERPGGAVLAKIRATLELEGSLEPAVTAELLFLVQPSQKSIPADIGGTDGNA